LTDKPVSGQYTHVLLPDAETAADIYGSFTGRWPPQAWRPVGESRDLIKARYDERRLHKGKAVSDHPISRYIEGVVHLLADGSLP